MAARDGKPCIKINDFQWRTEAREVIGSLLDSKFYYGGPEGMGLRERLALVKRILEIRENCG